MVRYGCGKDHKTNRLERLLWFLLRSWTEPTTRAGEPYTENAGIYGLKGRGGRGREKRKGRCGEGASRTSTPILVREARYFLLKFQISLSRSL